MNSDVLISHGLKVGGQHGALFPTSRVVLKAPTEDSLFHRSLVCECWLHPQGRSSHWASPDSSTISAVMEVESLTKPNTKYWRHVVKNSHNSFLLQNLWRGVGHFWKWQECQGEQISGSVDFCCSCFTSLILTAEREQLVRISFLFPLCGTRVWTQAVRGDSRCLLCPEPFYWHQHKYNSYTHLIK